MANPMNKIKTMTIAALLSAIGILIPTYSPIKILLEPFSFTFASHVPIFIAMFISPVIALCVALVTAFGFLIAGTFPLVVVFRALSHIVFALIGAYILKRNNKILMSLKTSIPFVLFIGLLHAACEVAVSSAFYFTGQAKDGFVNNVLILVGVGTIIHSTMDFIISVIIWVPLQHAVPIPYNARIKLKPAKNN